MIVKNETPPADRVLVLTRTFNAPRKLVFQAWTRPEYLAKWWGPKGFTLPHCTMDFRAGGKYRLCMRSPDGVDYWLDGEYVEIDEPKTLAFRWLRLLEGGRTVDTVVRLTFEEQHGKTKMTLHQSVFDSPQTTQEHRHGWSECLDRLVEYVQETPSSS